MSFNKVIYYEKSLIFLIGTIAKFISKQKISKLQTNNEVSDCKDFEKHIHFQIVKNQ